MDKQGKTPVTKLGLEFMDREHSGQLSLLNDVKAAIRSGAEDRVIYSLLNELFEQSNLHFLSEQLAMRLHAYKAAEAHLLEHQRLLSQIRAVQQDLATATTPDRHGLIEALRSWLVVHIETTDNALAKYLLEKETGP